MAEISIQTDENHKITENELILALFGMPVAELVKEIRTGKNDKYAELFNKTKADKTSA